MLGLSSILGLLGLLAWSIWNVTPESCPPYLYEGKLQFTLSPEGDSTHLLCEVSPIGTENTFRLDSLWYIGGSALEGLELRIASDTCLQVTVPDSLAERVKNRLSSYPQSISEGSRPEQEYRKEPPSFYL